MHACSNLAPPPFPYWTQLTCQYWGHFKKRNVWLYWDVIYIPQNSSKPNDVITSVRTRGKLKWYYVKEETMWQKQRLGCWLPLKAGKGKEIDFPLRRTRPSWHLLLGQWNWFQISDLQECKRINLCCFKLLNVCDLLQKQWVIQ